MCGYISLIMCTGEFIGNIIIKEEMAAMEEDIRIYGDGDSQSRLLPLKILSEVNMRTMMQFADSFIASLVLLEFNESAFED